MSLDVDKSTWTQVAFGDVIDSITDRVDDPSKAGVDRYVGLEHLDPGVMTVQRWDTPDKVEAQKLRFQPEDVIFGRRRAYQKKVARAEFEGICSAHALVLRARPGRIDPGFLPVFLSSAYFLDRAVQISVGSLSPTINWRDLKVQEFDLPPMPEQKRIAKLIWAMERRRRALELEAEETQRLADVLTIQRLRALPARKRLGDLAITRSGPSFSASDVHDDPVDGSVPVLGIPNTKPDGTVNLEGVGYVTGLAASVGRVDDSSLILIRTNGNRQRIGNVYLPPDETHGFAVSAFQFLMQVNDPSDRAFIHCVLREPGMQQRMSDAASGSVGLGNLAVRWLNDQEIPWSNEPNDRAALADEARILTNAVASIHDERVALDELRSRMQVDVFGGK